MAFDMDDLKNKGENFAKEHKDDAERLAREKMGGTNQQQSGQASQDQSRGGDTGMSGSGGTNMSDSGDMGGQSRDDMNRNREAQDYDDVA